MLRTAKFVLKNSTCFPSRVSRVRSPSPAPKCPNNARRMGISIRLILSLCVALPRHSHAIIVAHIRPLVARYTQGRAGAVRALPVRDALAIHFEAALLKPLLLAGRDRCRSAGKSNQHASFNRRQYGAGGVVLCFPRRAYVAGLSIMALRLIHFHVAASAGRMVTTCRPGDGTFNVPPGNVWKM